MNAPGLDARAALIDGDESVHRNLRSKSVRGALFIAGGGAVEFVLRVISTALLARLITPEHFGLVGMVTALAAIALQFSQLGLATATVQREKLSDQLVTNLFWVNAGVGTGLGVAFYFLSSSIASFYGDERLVLINMVLSTGFLWSGLTVQHEALLARQMKQGQSSLVRLVSTSISVVFAVSLAYWGYGYWALVCQELARNVFIMVGIWLACPWRPGLPKRDKELSSLLRFGTDLTVAQLLYAVISNVDRLLIGKLFGPGALGMYRQAQQLMMVPIEQLSAPVGSVAQSGLSRLQSCAERYRRYYQKVVYMLALGTMPAAAFGALYADEIVRVILGTAWAGAAPLFRVFALAAFIRPTLGTAGIVLISSGRSRRLLMITLVSQVTLLISLVVGLKWGALGVAMAYLLTATVLLLPNLHFSFSGTPVNMATFFQGVRSPALASAIMVAGLILFRAVGVERVNAADLILSICFGGILYLVSLVLLPGGRGELVDVITDVAGPVPIHRLSPNLSATLTRIIHRVENAGEGPR